MRLHLEFLIVLNRNTLDNFHGVVGKLPTVIECEDNYLNALMDSFPLIMPKPLPASVVSQTSTSVFIDAHCNITGGLRHKHAPFKRISYYFASE